MSGRYATGLSKGTIRCARFRHHAHENNTLTFSAVTTDSGRLDILVNNAAILYDAWQQGITADLEVVHTALETNLFGAWRMCQTFLPLLRQSSAGRIVNVSSEGGSLASMGAGTDILVNAVCPGWVATDMEGVGGRPVAEGAAGIVWAFLLVRRRKPRRDLQVQAGFPTPSVSFGTQ